MSDCPMTGFAADPPPHPYPPQKPTPGPTPGLVSADSAVCSRPDVPAAVPSMVLFGVPLDQDGQPDPPHPLTVQVTARHTAAATAATDPLLWGLPGGVPPYGGSRR